MSFAFWRIEDLTTRESYEDLLARLGGEPLAAQRDRLRATRGRLQAALTPDLRELYLDSVDAVCDANALREEAAVQAALALGVGLGAALASCPDEPSATVLATASGVVSAVLGSGLSAPDAHEVARAALDALRRLPAEHPRSTPVP